MAIFKWSVVTVVKGLVLALIAGVVLVFFGAANAGERNQCTYSAYVCGSIQGRNRATITDTARREIFNLYDPGPHSDRLQIRSGNFMDNRILGYVEKSTGRITNTVRQPMGTVHDFFTD